MPMMMLSNRRHVLMALALMISAAPAFAEPQPPLPVTIVTVERATTSIDAALTGVTAPRDQAQISFRDGGRIISLDVDIGDKVSAGQVLGQVDDFQASEQLHEAEAARDVATANLERARQEFERQSQLLDRGVATFASFDAAQESHQSAEAALTQAETDVARAQRTLDETRLIAPDDGSVLARMAEPGQIVGPAVPVLELAVGADVVANFSVPDIFLTRPIEGLPIELRPIDRPQNLYSGQILEVSPMVDASSSSVGLKVAIDPVDGRLPDYGVAIEGRVAIGTQPLITLPWTVLTVSGGDIAVWVLDPATNRVALREVTVARYITGSVLISDGLDPGEQVIAAGSHQLYPNRPVIVVEAPK